MKTTIRIHREKRILWFLVNLKVFIDGQRVGRIPNGGEVLIPVSPGGHTVSLKSIGVHSREVTVIVPEGESVSMTAHLPTAEESARVSRKKILVFFSSEEVLRLTVD